MGLCLCARLTFASGGHKYGTAVDCRKYSDGQEYHGWKFGGYGAYQSALQPWRREPVWPRLMVALGCHTASRLDNWICD